MRPAERFLKYAAECEIMSKLSRSTDNRAVWDGLAQRWIRCAKLADQLDDSLQSAVVARRQKRSRPSSFN
jgi:hypothetical protein